MKKIYYLFICLLLIPVFTFAQSIGTGSGAFTIVSKADGTVYTWGDNCDGQLGNGTSGYMKISKVPVAVNTTGVLGGKTITAVAAGMYHSIALADDNNIYTWGSNTFGQLGNGTSGDATNSNVPVAVDKSGVLSGKKITAVVAGGYGISIALASNGKVYTWGSSETGQLGNGTRGDGIISSVPVAVDTTGVLSGKKITEVATGGWHSIALASDSTVYTWGYNYSGQLGNGSEDTYSNVPVAVYTNGVLSGKKITAVATGSAHSIALASDGKVYTWGYGYRGELGNEDSIETNVPVAVYTNGVLKGKKITAIAAGYSHSIALASDGKVYTWGSNQYGQLGNGSEDIILPPIKTRQQGKGENWNIRGNEA